MNIIYAISSSIYLLLSFGFFFGWIKPLFSIRYGVYKPAPHIWSSFGITLITPTLFCILCERGNGWDGRAFMDISTFMAFFAPINIAMIGIRYKDNLKALKSDLINYIKPRKPTLEELEAQLVDLQHQLTTIPA